MRERLARAWPHADCVEIAERASPPSTAALRVGVRGRQRLPRRARHARGGHARPRRRRGAQRLPRDAGRSSTPRTPTGSRAPGRRSSTPTDGSIDPPVRRRRAARPRDRAGRCASSACSTCAPACCSREVEWETARGRGCSCARAGSPRSRDRHLVAIDYEVDALDARRRIAISSELVHPRAGAGRRRSAPRQGLRRGLLDAGRGATRVGTAPCCTLATRNSGLELACGMEHDVDGADGHGRDERRGRRRAASSCSPTLAAGDSLRLRKYVAYHWAAEAPRGDLLARAERTLDRARRERLRRDRGRPRARASRSSGSARRRARGRARACSGRALQPLPADAGDRARRGPRRARQGRDRARLRGPLLLGHRDLRRAVPHPHRPRSGPQALAAAAAMLDAARKRAREVGHEGALFPWRTINGEEASAWYAAGTAQYHINADIAYAMHQYNRVTGDLGFLLEQGAEVLVETARLWMRARLLLRAPRRALLHQRRHRAGRVHDRRRQQRLHEPDGAGRTSRSRRA